MEATIDRYISAASSRLPAPLFPILSSHPGASKSSTPQKHRNDIATVEGCNVSAAVQLGGSSNGRPGGQAYGMTCDTIGGTVRPHVESNVRHGLDMGAERSVSDGGSVRIDKSGRVWDGSTWTSPAPSGSSFGSSDWGKLSLEAQ